MLEGSLATILMRARLVHQHGAMICQRVTVRLLAFASASGTAGHLIRSCILNDGQSGAF